MNLFYPVLLHEIVLVRSDSLLEHLRRNLLYASPHIAMDDGSSAGHC